MNEHGPQALSIGQIGRARQIAIARPVRVAESMEDRSHDPLGRRPVLPYPGHAQRRGGIDVESGLAA
jgi:hypothetical protein